MPLKPAIDALISDISIVKQRSNISTAPVVLMGVTKGQPIEKIEEAISAGLILFGENRVQEAAEKWPSLHAKYPKIKLHLIGPLQTNKVKEAMELFDAIETIDRPKLVEAIAKHQSPDMRCQKFFVQVNTGKESQKAGVFPEQVDELIALCRTLQLPIAGLMCVPPVDQPPAPHFALLHEIAKRHGLTELSMGMSGDWQTAIRMGSTCVRIGTALFGSR